MQIALKSKFGRGGVMLVALAAFLAAAIRISKTYLAERAAQKTTLGNLQLAVRLDPTDSEHHSQLARIVQYSLTDLNPEQAVAHLKRATELNPRDPQLWLDLGRALEFQGRTAEAQASLRRADSLAPNIPALQWTIGNFFLLHGNVEESFRHFKVVLAESDQNSDLLFTTAWKASGDAKKILDELIPDRVPIELTYLNYLVARQRYPEAQAVWKRIAASSEAFSSAQAASYIENLIGAHRAGEAYQVWDDLRNKGLIKATYEETSQNLVINGDFEEDPLNMGFDWRIVTTEGAYADLDRSTFRSPSQSLLIQFTGEQNLDYRHVFQYIRVKPGRPYRFRGHLKTEGITSDSGPCLVVRDAYDPGSLFKLTENFRGDSTSWTPLTVDFTTGPKTDLVVVGVARLPSRKLDNLIAGKVWVDDITLTELPPETTRARK